MGRVVVFLPFYLSIKSNQTKSVFQRFGQSKKEGRRMKRETPQSFLSPTKTIKLLHTLSSYMKLKKKRPVFFFYARYDMIHQIVMGTQIGGGGICV